MVEKNIKCIDWRINMEYKDIEKVNEEMGTIDIKALIR